MEIIFLDIYNKIDILKYLFSSTSRRKEYTECFTKSF